MATAATVFRDYETDGVPASGSHKPKKPDIRQLLAGYESIINAFLSNGGLIYASKALLDADLAHGANSMAWVLGDATVANNGIYRKNGASGTGSWTRVGDLPYSFIKASNAGAGTANAIVATTSIPVSGVALIWLNIFATNTASPVTVSFNGDAAVTIKTNAGNDVAVGGLVSGMVALGIILGDTFRLMSDQASAAIVAAAEAAADRAEAAATALETIDQRIIVISDDTNRVTYPNFAALVVDGDWAPAFNAAMAATKVVLVPPANFLCKSQVVFQQEGQSLVGMGPPRPNANLSGSPRLIYDAALGTSELLWFKYTGHFNRIAVKGPGKGTGVPWLGRKPTDYGEAYEDTDLDITECTFDSWQYAGRHWNRGLRFHDNLVALCNRSVKFEGFDTANFVDSAGNPFDNIPEGYRAISLCGNRMHAVDIAFENTGLNSGSLRGLICNNNLMDIGDGLWHGGLFSGSFVGNVIDQTSAAVGLANFTTDVQDVSLVGNRAQGDPLQGIPAQFVEFSGVVNEVTISGNSFRSASSYGVNFSGAVAGGLITGNAFQAIGTAGNSTRACIRGQSTFTNLAITGNYFDPTTDAYCVRGSTGMAWTGVTIQGNSWNRSRLLSGVFTDGGNNSIQT